MELNVYENLTADQVAWKLALAMYQYGMSEEEIRKELAALGVFRDRISLLFLEFAKIIYG